MKMFEFKIDFENFEFILEFCSLQFCGYLFDDIIFEYISDLQVIEVFDHDTALIPCLYFPDIFLESFERTDLPVIDNDIVPDDPRTIA